MNPRMTDLRRLDHHDFERGSGLPLDYFLPRTPWYATRRWRWAAIAVLAVALIGLWYTGNDLPNF